MKLETLLSQDFVLKVAPNVGTVWGTLHSKDRREDK